MNFSLLYNELLDLYRMNPAETKTILLLLILVILVGFIIYYFFISMQKHHNKIIELKLKNIISELSYIEEDRARIAADLHDELSPIISAVKFKVGSFNLPESEDKEEQEKTNDHLNQILQRLRSISYNLMPVTLRRKGIKAAIEEFISYSNIEKNLLIDFHATDIGLHAMQEIHLYRIAQEIIQNTIKHSGAEELKIEIKQDDKKVIFSSRDNGKGFDYDARLTEESGFGLRNLLSRTDVLGGSLYIESKKDVGTIYLIEIPVKQKDQ